MSRPDTSPGAEVVNGFCAPGWEQVREVFHASLASGLDLGASVCVYRDGAPVVDLWGGVADSRTGRLWAKGTVACVFSTAKGVTGICAHLLAQRGLLELDAPVASYWPEFAQAGKQDIKVRWLLDHRAGLPVLDAELSLEELLAQAPILRALERQAPLWEPGTKYGYHAVTYGPLVGEVIRRVVGERLGLFMDKELGYPLGAVLHLGLPESQALDLAHLEPMPPAGDLVALLGEQARPLAERFLRSITLGHALPGDLVTGQPGDFNDRRVLAIELAGSNLVTNARSLARVYAATVSDVDGRRLLSDETVRALLPELDTTPSHGVPDELLAKLPPREQGPGFTRGEMLGLTSFGYSGAGGSTAFADLDSRTAFAYVPNRMCTTEDFRARDLVLAVRACSD